MSREEYASDEEETGGTKEGVGNVLLEIASHIFQITITFLMIFGIAIALDIGIRYLEQEKLLLHNTPILYALYCAKYVILLADCTLLITLVYKLTVRAMKHI